MSVVTCLPSLYICVKESVCCLPGETAGHDILIKNVEWNCRVSEKTSKEHGRRFQAKNADPAVPKPYRSAGRPCRSSGIYMEVCTAATKHPKPLITLKLIRV